MTEIQVEHYSRKWSIIPKIPHSLERYLFSLSEQMTVWQKLTSEIHCSINCTLSGKLAVFGQETPNKQPCNEAKNCPKQHEQADTHQEAGSPARLSQVLGHHHIIFKLTVLSLLKAVRSLDSSFNSGQASLGRVSLMMSVSHPCRLAGYWPLSRCLCPPLAFLGSSSHRPLESWH